MPAIHLPEERIHLQIGSAEMGSKEIAMTAEAHQGPNPKRVAAGRLNRLKRKGLTPEGREKLRRAALEHQPWRYARGPTTLQGKARWAQNGRTRQKEPVSLRQVRAELADLRSMVAAMQETRRAAAEPLAPGV
ncbi:MAG TPA: hypothetical protein VMS17_29215 [Gemmataceae bacterium]|nr:hypothetical protein [Gemmataceae bacterium]